MEFGNKCFVLLLLLLCASCQQGYIKKNKPKKIQEVFTSWYCIPAMVTTRAYIFIKYDDKSYLFLESVNPVLDLELSHRFCLQGHFCHVKDETTIVINKSELRAKNIWDSSFYNEKDTADPLSYGEARRRYGISTQPIYLFAIPENLIFQHEDILVIPMIRRGEEELPLSEQRIDTLVLFRQNDADLSKLKWIKDCDCINAEPNIESRVEPRLEDRKNADGTPCFWTDAKGVQQKCRPEESKTRFKFIKAPKLYKKEKYKKPKKAKK